MLIIRIILIWGIVITNRCPVIQEIRCLEPILRKINLHAYPPPPLLPIKKIQTLTRILKSLNSISIIITVLQSNLRKRRMHFWIIITILWCKGKICWMRWEWKIMKMKWIMLIYRLMFVKQIKNCRKFCTIPPTIMLYLRPILKDSTMKKWRMENCRNKILLLWNVLNPLICKLCKTIKNLKKSTKKVLWCNDFFILYI